ncbi:MAG: hypothetical protein HC806_07125 [Anaerolineae bacterium]|nr:hypothetical protein [Anaerolineae bacterium]
MYFVNGVGGQFTYSFAAEAVEGSQFQFTGQHGAQFVTASETALTFEFHSIQNGGTLVDTHTITVPHSPPTPTNPAEVSGWHSPAGQASLSDGDGNGFEVDPTNAFNNDSLFAMDINSGTTTGINCINLSKDKHRFF